MMAEGRNLEQILHMLRTSTAAVGLSVEEGRLVADEISTLRSVESQAVRFIQEREQVEHTHERLRLSLQNHNRLQPRKEPDE